MWNRIKTFLKKCTYFRDIFCIAFHFFLPWPFGGTALLVQQPNIHFGVWGLSVHKHLLGDTIGKMQQACRTVWEPWNPIRESSLWPSPWLGAVFYQLQSLSAAFQPTAQALCKAAGGYYKLKGKGMQGNALPKQEWANKVSNLGG